jgi:hypothetical protein
LIAVCAGKSFGNPLTSVSVSRNTIEATYLATRWDWRYRDANGNVYIDNTSGAYREGKDTPHFGTSVSLVVTLSDGTTTYQGAPTISLAPYSRQYGMPYNCEFWGVTICRENRTTEVGRRGIVNADRSY